MGGQCGEIKVKGANLSAASRGFVGLLSDLTDCQLAECTALDVEISTDKSTRDGRNDDYKHPADYFLPLHDCP
jgi:hypothetical protein